MPELKVVILVLLGAVIVSLGKALFHMSSGAYDGARMARALTVRVVLSLLLFTSLFVAWHFNLITPHGVR
jgi:heme/copper-type cytochrome/quinol oxidase subunit 4